MTEVTSASIIREGIEALLTSDISGYEIEKRTGISRSTIHYLRIGKRDIDNLSWKSAQKLYNLSLSLKRKN